jgi:hypothetical protein
MVEPTDIEKKSLEAHVELCAERYNALHDTITLMKKDMADLCTMIKDVKSTVSKMAEKNNDRLINWGVAIISFLVVSVAGLIAHIVIK